MSASMYHGWDQMLQRPVDDAESPVDAKGKRSRQTYSKYQTAVLETVFQTSKYIVRSKRQQMSAELNLTERQIKIWFQNRRMKDKKSHKDQPPQTDLTGYVDGYGSETSTTGYPPLKHIVSGDAYTADYPEIQPAKHEDPYSGTYRDFDLLAPASHDSYGIAKHQWSPVATAQFHQNFYNDTNNFNHSDFHRLPTNHHHSFDSPVSDYCPPQLHAHGY
ncbi:segmentation protein fushi tarazu-like isoform X2 [Daktulosphaira vitifoliae]|uniref:segmentation protein fushi tarazu-like isoform X2 n=2 Tax=Daktulosphaira vitifoliae TaxID=58002 RepID=UPI0021A9C049|nr:segmentation protein fushi tarazu-like isoform X2 [Daktulosphaira vitifoliae]